MLKQFWAVPSAKEAMRYSNIPDAELLAAVDRLAGGEPPENVLSDRFVDAFTIAGTADKCLDRINAYARAGLLSDVELIDDYPSHFSGYCRRKHRWVRGDWQILRWILGRVPDAHGKMIRNPISMIRKTGSQHGPPADRFVSCERRSDANIRHFAG